MPYCVQNIIYVKKNKKGMKNQDLYHKILSIPVANER